MVWISNGIWNPEAQPFEIQKNGGDFVKNHLKSRPKYSDFAQKSRSTVLNLIFCKFNKIKIFYV